MAKYLKIRDSEILESTYQSYLQATDRKLYPNLDGMRTALDKVASVCLRRKIESLKSLSTRAFGRNWTKKVFSSRCTDDRRMPIGASDLLFQFRGSQQRDQTECERKQVGHIHRSDEDLRVTGVGRRPRNTRIISES
jgi:CHAD domain-containing protein